jgi:CRP/FNR family transcriptional regulator, cyclic AMP receptor protein
MAEFLDTLSRDAQAALQSTLRLVPADRGSLVFHTEDQAETLYLISSGRIRLYRLGQGAREVTITVLEAGELLGESALAGGDYGMYAEALEDCELQAIGIAALRQLMTQHHSLSFALSTQLVRQGRALQTRFTQLVFMEVAQRLALALLRLADQSDEQIDGKRRLKGRVSHQDLAHLVGSTRETITKLLGEFKDRSLIDLGYRRIVLLNEDGLREITLNPPPF